MIRLRHHRVANTGAITGKGVPLPTLTHPRTSRKDRSLRKERRVLHNSNDAKHTHQQPTRAVGSRRNRKAQRGHHDLHSTQPAVHRRLHPGAQRAHTHNVQQVERRDRKHRQRHPLTTGRAQRHTRQKRKHERRDRILQEARAHNQRHRVAAPAHEAAEGLDVRTGRRAIPQLPLAATQRDDLNIHRESTLPGNTPKQQRHDRSAHRSHNRTARGTTPNNDDSRHQHIREKERHAQQAVPRQHVALQRPKHGPLRRSTR